MPEKAGGARPRPRVAVVGEFSSTTLEYFEKLFPTIWPARSFSELITLVPPLEIDLTIIGTIEEFDRFAIGYLGMAHCISFSDKIELVDIQVPGPGFRMMEKISAFTEVAAEEFILPDIPLSYYRRREIDFLQLNSIKRWKKILYECNFTNSEKKLLPVYEKLKVGALIKDKYSLTPLASIIHQPKRLGFAWLPNPIFNQAAWVELICMEWAQTDHDRFPDFGNWQKMPEWMVPEEEAIEADIESLIHEKEVLIKKIDQQIVALSSQLSAVTISANQSVRRLITAQNRDLVDEVAAAFKELGFSVKDMDAALPTGMQKREDLRITAPEKSEWEAIVEVRGYSRSGGKQEDFTRLADFATYYYMEKKRLPDKRVYVVNGEIDVLPNQRQLPFASGQDALNVFAETGGLVIWSLDLFRAVKLIGKVPVETIRSSIIEALGRWKLPKLSTEE